MSTVDERKKIAEEITELTQSIEQANKILKDKFFVSKSLTGSIYHWGDVSMMYSDRLIDDNINEKFCTLYESVSELK